MAARRNVAGLGPRSKQRGLAAWADDPVAVDDDSGDPGSDRIVITAHGLVRANFHHLTGHYHHLAR